MRRFLHAEVVSALGGFRGRTLELELGGIGQEPEGCGRESEGSGQGAGGRLLGPHARESLRKSAATEVLGRRRRRISRMTSSGTGGDEEECDEEEATCAVCANCGPGFGWMSPDNSRINRIHQGAI